jgi:hypothetical protein
MQRRRGTSHRRVAELACAIAAVALFAVLGACSLFVSTDGLTSDAVVDAAVDTSSDVRDASSTFDAITTADAGTDAAFCNATASTLFCDDFDHGAIGATWDSAMTTAGATLALDSTTFRSPPSSGAFTSGGNSSAANLIKSVAASVGNYRVAFSLRVATPPSASSAYQIIATFANGNGAQLELLEGTGGFSVNDRINGTYDTQYSDVPGLDVGAWHDVVVHLKFAASGGTTSASVDVDGTNVVPSFDVASAFNQPSALKIALGVVFGAGSSTSINFDNAAIFSE